MPRRFSITLGYLAAVLVFLVVATYAVLYATGYKIDWTTWELKKTGFILIESYPKGAEIKLAGKATNKTTPETIKRLLPGTYKIELNKEGYRPWQGDVTVASGLVAEERNILLTRQDIKSAMLLDLQITALVSNLDNTKLALLAGKDISLWDIKNHTNSGGTNALLIRQQIKDHNTVDIANGKLEPLGFGPDNQTLLFRSTGSINQYYLTLNTASGVTKLIGTGRNIVNWKWLDDKEIAWVQNNKLNLFNFTSGKIQVLADNVLDYAWLDNNFYLAQKNKSGKIFLVKLTKNSEATENLAELPGASSYYIGKIKNNWLIIANQGKFSSIWIEDKSANKLAWRLLADNITAKVLWDDQYIAYRQGEELKAVEWDKLDQSTTIAPLKNGELVHFSFDTLLYLDNQTLKSIDLTGQNKYDLFAVAQADQLVITEPQISQIVFIDAKTRQLSEVTLREKTNTLF